MLDDDDDGGFVNFSSTSIKRCVKFDAHISNKWHALVFRSIFIHFSPNTGTLSMYFIVFRHTELKLVGDRIDCIDAGIDSVTLIGNAWIRSNFVGAIVAA